VKDGESLPEWEEDAGVDPNDGGWPELAMEGCIDNLDRFLDDDKLANEISVFCRVLDRWDLAV
jgi:hypothetical protein